MFQKDISKVIDTIEAKSTLVFDFDGVLADSVSIKTWAFAELYQEYGDEVTDKVVEYHLNNGGMSRFNKFKYYHSILLDKPITQAIMDQLNIKFSNLVTAAVIGSQEIPGVTKFLEYYCSVDRVICINSATPIGEIREIVTKRGMDHFFNGVYGSPKSKVDNLNDIFSIYNTTPEDTVFFGDSLADFEAAEIVRCNFVGIGESFESILGSISPQSDKKYGFLKDFKNTI